MRDNIKKGDKMDKMNPEQAEFMMELIYSVVKSPYNTDKDAIEEIVRIFETYGMRCGIRSNKAPKYFVLTEE